jgi:hypothetical protein
MAMRLIILLRQQLGGAYINLLPAVRSSRFVFCAGSKRFMKKDKFTGKGSM